MKRNALFLALAAVVIGTVAFLVLAPASAPALGGPLGLVQDQPASAPGVDPSTVEAIMIILTGGGVTLIMQGLKKKTKITGTLAKMVTGIIGVAIVGLYFLIVNPPFEVTKFILYSAVIFGEATGWYHLYQKRTV